MLNGTEVTIEKGKRKKNLHVISAVLLVLNGVPALIAGLNLMLVPSGGGLGFQLSLLETSPFHDFFIPGLILFLVNGVFSIVTLYALIRQIRLYSLMIILQGIVLTGWITFQIMLITDPSWLQLAYGFLGILLIVSGLKLENLNNERRAYQKV